MKAKQFGLLLLIFLFHCPVIFCMTAEELASKFSGADTVKSTYQLEELARKNINLLEEIVLTYNNKPDFCWKRIQAISFLTQFSWEGSYPREKFFDLSCQALKGIQRHSASNGKEEEILEYRNDLGNYSFISYIKKGRVSLAENFEAYTILVKALGKHDLIFNKMVVKEFPKKIEVAKHNFFDGTEKKTAISKIQEIIDMTLALGEKDIHLDAQRILRRYGENLILHIQTELKN